MKWLCDPIDTKLEPFIGRFEAVESVELQKRNETAIVSGDKSEAWLELTGTDGAKDFIISELGL
ncbi:hypothetical protein [Sphingobacterium chuzhouense]|uniref:Uncharacterized protein n=1 Tax=Sphingobacterium chuzhouense TaxID=1742264 RepID=A0ABR7XV58_9SPHI|nr:hypothetical protein [Sphingobacterium chuzhouense]MBD1422941.1 hypothetical protein [Sphingobacterium chuzhouense]